MGVDFEEFHSQRKIWNMCIRRNVKILYAKLSMLNLAHVKLVNDVSTHTFFYKMFFEHYAKCSRKARILLMYECLPLKGFILCRLSL